MKPQESKEMNNPFPTIINDINNGNISALDEYFKQGWNIEEDLLTERGGKGSPLKLALISESFNSVKWLVEHGANLNVEDNPSFLIAVRYCDHDIIRYIVANGAKVSLVNSVKSDPFKEALYGKRNENLPLIHELGYSVEKYGGKAFRKAVSDRNYKALDFFIAHGVDINYNEPDMVYPFKPTPLCVAARYVDYAMCKYLVEHGADVTLPENDGMRPYTIALEKDDNELAEYFKSLEPAEYHNVENKLQELVPYKLPQELIDFLQGDDLHMDLPDCDFGFIEFFSLTQIVPFEVEGQKIIRLSKRTEDYDHISFVWNPETEKIAYYDMEHGELEDLCSFEEFLDKPILFLYL